MNADFGFDLEARREYGKALHEPARKDAIARQYVREAAPEKLLQQAGKRPVAEAMAAPIGLLHLAATSADDHVEIVFEHRGYEAWRRRRFVGRIPVSHDVDVRLHIGEHAPDDMPLALLRHAPDDRPRICGQFIAAVGAVVIEHVDVGGGKRAAEILHRLHDRACLIIAGKDHGNAGTGRPLLACHCWKFLHLPQTFRRTPPR